MLWSCTPLRAGAGEEETERSGAWRRRSGKREAAAPLALATVVVLVIVEADMKKRGRMEIVRRFLARALSLSIQRLPAIQHPRRRDARCEPNRECPNR